MHFEELEVEEGEDDVFGAVDRYRRKLRRLQGFWVLRVVVVVVVIM